MTACAPRSARRAPRSSIRNCSRDRVWRLRIVRGSHSDLDGVVPTSIDAAHMPADRQRCWPRSSCRGRHRADRRHPAHLVRDDRRSHVELPDRSRLGISGVRGARRMAGHAVPRRASRLGGPSYARGVVLTRCIATAYLFAKLAVSIGVYLVWNDPMSHWFGFPAGRENPRSTPAHAPGPWRRRRARWWTRDRLGT